VITVITTTAFYDGRSAFYDGRTTVDAFFTTAENPIVAKVPRDRPDFYDGNDAFSATLLKTCLQCVKTEKRGGEEGFLEE